MVDKEWGWENYLILTLLLLVSPLAWSFTLPLSYHFPLQVSVLWLTITSLLLLQIIWNESTRNAIPEELLAG